MPHDRNRVSSCINKILNKYENSLVVEIRRPKWWLIGEPENEEKCSSVAAVILKVQYKNPKLHQDSHDDLSVSFLRVYRNSSR